MAHGTGWRSSRIRRAILPVITVLALGTTSLTAAATERLVLAISPPTVETNRFWAGGDWSSVGQAMEMLVGADPVTGELDNSALAESWSAGDDSRTWTFKLKEGVEFHHGYGEVTAEDYWHLIEAAN
jgi:peptide/nickel transport system substrate-binding protein